VNFAFSEEQEMLRDSAREVMAERYPPERVAAIADGEGFVRAEWGTVAQLGWTGISVPEGEGGAGLGFLEEVVVVEELGRALYPGPFLSTVVLALAALREADAADLVARVVAGDATATLAWAGPEGMYDADPPPKAGWDGERLSATRLFVPDLDAADLIVVIGAAQAGTGVWAVERDAAGVSWRILPTVDTTRRLGEVGVTSGPVLAAAFPSGGWLARLRDRALAALAAEAVGVAGRAVELAVSHARSREQFGRPIGAFQAVAHELAQAFLEVETARSLAYWAAWAVAEDVPEAGMAAAAAKARAADAAVDACERAIQAHGGIGFTWEHPLHRSYKRALGIAATFGWGTELRARVAADLVAGGEPSDRESAGPAPTIEA
jgi:alkylation response protein AidB-like acyl-CoA dehydrogenase